MSSDTTCEPTIDEVTRKEIAWRLRYCGDDIGHQMEELFRHWWGRRKGTPRWERLGRDHWKRIFNGIVAQVRGESEMRSRGRCPGCGCKLKAARCLACDLRSGVVDGRK